MKKIIYIICFLAFSQVAVGQGIKMRIANRLYKDLHFAEAKQQYEEIVAKSPENLEAEEKLAHCYRHLNDSENAEVWYSKVVNNPRAEAEDKLYYAQALAENGKYDESKKWYEIYAKEVENDQRGENFVSAYNNLKDFYSDSANYRVEQVPFNSEASDFSPMLYNGNLIFCSNRHSVKKNAVKRTFKWTKSAFLDLYIVEEGSEEAKLFHENVNTKYHEGPVAFFDNGNKMIFTRNNYYQGKYKKSDDDINKLKLYIAEKSGEDWVNLKEFPYNNDEYSIGHPTVSADGQWLYFASDMPNGKGGVDIYKCKIENGTFGQPINLGDGINTKGEEMFPYIDTDGNLYFASDGHGGMGGLDIFLAVKSGEDTFEKPLNVGYPLNSSQDDFGLVFDNAKGYGYFTSHDRANGVGDDDIFKFYRKNPPTQLIAISGLTYHSQTNENIDGSSIVIKNMNTGDIQTYSSANGGKFDIQFKSGQPYEIVVVKEGFERTLKVINQEESKTMKNGDVVRIPLTPIQTPFEKVVIYNIYYDYNKYNIRVDAQENLEEIIDVLEEFEQANISLRSHTDKRNTNEYNTWLAMQRAKAAQKYLVSKGIKESRIEISGAGEEELVNNCEDCTEEEHQLNRRTEFVIQLNGKTVKSIKPNDIVVGGKE